ncbi:hypothetical protein HS088_TW16G00028 [Tripterygium wilfordii]|uniref:Uncharacterized protein n=1 Tax=Tripterygium wilfordii TaxID=458696 RepID=A0A7J7CHR4_TRIWF|nr:uncharacterized protein LOC119980796 [Tripterygium wilfordii]XP_038679518.1 uncharacterized protein LOC119980796 [Tripterygium wilfordii]KAF5733588.1 hypothetical protein HS088_TW16G00028 [Tripterygium wilfordii]
MVIPDSGLFATTNNRTQAGVDVYMTEDHLHELQFLVTEDPKILMKKESVKKEKQIMVDPISLRQSSLREASFNILLQPVVTARNSPPPLLPANSRFVSCSLPNSASSSARFSFNHLKKKWRNEGQESPRKIDLIARQHSSAHSLQQVIDLRKSQSYAEGKAYEPSDEFDLWFSEPNATKLDNRNHESFNKTKTGKVIHKNGKNMDHDNDEFKCGALCLYLPGFGKGKPVRTRKVEPEMENVISRTVSLEKFECGSWASSAIHEEDGDSTNRYFDLPLELIQSSVNDAHSPVTTAFMFDKDRRVTLKHGPTRATSRKSHESSRHVRFPPSSPSSNPASPASCISPRLRKAREDFNAFLQAQSA